MEWNESLPLAYWTWPPPFTCPFAARLTLFKHQTLHWIICIPVSMTVLERKESVVFLYLPQIQRETHWEINKTLQIVGFPLFIHNCPVVPSALLVELSRTIGRPQSPQAVAFCSWRWENYRSLQTIPEMSLLWGYRVFYHFFLDWWRNEDGCGRDRKISKDYLAHLKREWLFWT